MEMRTLARGCCQMYVDEEEGRVSASPRGQQSISNPCSLNEAFSLVPGDYCCCWFVGPLRKVCGAFRKINHRSKEGNSPQKKSRSLCGEFDNSIPLEVIL